MTSLVRPCFLAGRLTGTGSLPFAACRRFQHSLVPGEPEGPTVHTEIPGPISKQRYQELNAIQVQWKNWPQSYQEISA